MFSKSTFLEIGHQNYDKKIELELELFFNLGPPERQCAEAEKHGWRGGIAAQKVFMSP